jgi:pimeloyl-ACP methyl ester carboxylesterase
MSRLIYLHGFASGPLSTKAQYFRARFAEHGHDLAIPELAPDFTHMTVTSQLAIVRPLLDGDGSVLLGSSLGGYLAALLAAREPARVRALVLMAPAFDFAARWQAEVGPEAMRRWRARGTAPVMHYGRAREEPLSIGLLDDAATYPAEPDPACPALVLTGSRDEAVPVAVVRRFAAGRPDRELVVYDSDHQLTDVTPHLWERTRRYLAALGLL